MSFFSNIWITGASKPLTLLGAGGGDSLCNIYIFSDTNPDSLELGSPFTGNLKVQIASDSETGIHPDIIAGRQKAFVASTDVINDPQWVQYEISAVAIPWLVDATYNGRIAYAKDDVWNYLDMGYVAPTRYFIELDNTLNSHYTLNTSFVAASDFEVEIHTQTYETGTHLFGNTDTDRIAIASDGSLVFKANNIQVQLAVSDSSFVDNQLHKIVVRRTSNNLSLIVDDVDRGVVGGSSNTLTISTIGYYTGATATPMINGIAFDVKLSGDGVATQSYSLNQATGTSETSSEGSDTITYVNIPEANRELYEFDGGTSSWVSGELADSRYNGTVTESSQWSAIKVNGVIAFSSHILQIGGTYRTESTLEESDGEIQIRYVGQSTSLTEVSPKNLEFSVPVNDTSFSYVSASPTGYIVGSTVTGSIKRFIEVTL